MKQLAHMIYKTNTAVTKEEATPALVPKLRFPEFRGTGGWDVKPFQKLFTIGSGRDYKHLSGGSIPVYGSGGYMLSVDDFLYDGESVCIGRKGTINNPMFLTGKFWTVDTLFYTHSFRDCLPKFVYAIFQNIDWLKHNEAGGVPSLSKTIIEKIQTALPGTAEQQKIAECLSSVDELMAAQARKVDALKTHKKGLMQQLFPREGETQPRLRFPEFRDAGEWSDAPMGTLLMSSPDYGVNAAAVPFSEDLPKYLRITDISEGGRYLPEKQVSVDLDATQGNYLDEGDIVLARTGASVGKSYQYLVEDGRLVFAGFLIRVKPHPKKLVSIYLSNYLTSGHFWKWVAITSARSGQPGINSTEYSSLSVPLPPTLPEQQRIASCLSSLDALITAETQNLETLKTHKKGLMQQLFPSPDEASA